MPFAEHFMLQGQFTAPETLPGTVNVNCGFIPTRVELVNLTRLGDSSANENWERVYWQTAFGTSNTMVEWHTASSTALNMSNVTANGITPYDGSVAPSYAAPLTGTLIDKTNGQFTVSSTASLNVGDLVRITNNVVMKQIGGLTFRIATINSGTVFTISDPGFLNTANFTNESGFRARKLLVPAMYYPSRYTITAITRANPAVVTTSVAHGLTVGQQVRIRVPSQFGMVEINNLQGIISAVTTTTFTLGGLKTIDSSAFTAFAWPAATAVPFTPAIVEPIGSGPTPITVSTLTYNVDQLDDATANVSFQGFTVGNGLLLTATGAVIGIQASDVILWTAWRADV